MSPHNLSLKAIIIIRSFRPSHGGKIWALLSLDKWNADSRSYEELQAITGGWGSAWGWMIDRDDPDLGRDRVIRSDGVIRGRTKAAKDGSRKERWWRAKKEGGAEEGKQRRMPVQDKTILKPLSPSRRPSPSWNLFRRSTCQDRASALQVGAMTHCYVNGNQMRATLTPWNHSKISLRLSLTY